MSGAAVQRGPADESSSRVRSEVPTSRAPGRIHLSQREVEQVIARAVELQQDREVGRGTGLTLDDLQAVAAQVGVESDLVRRALDEVRLGTNESDEAGYVDRVLGPRHVAGAAVVAGDPDEIARAIADWMTTDEGMLLAGTRDGAERWVPDNRLLTQVRHGLHATRSESALRGLRGVTARTEPASGGTLVAIEADTSSIRLANAAVLSGSGVIGIGAGLVVAALVPDSATIASDAAQFTIGFSLPVAAGAGITAIVHRSWLGRVRRAVVHALDGITMTSRERGDPPSPPSDDWRTVTKRWLGGR